MRHLASSTDSRAMIDWRDDGLVIAVRPHGETSAILEVFTPGHGRHLGVVRGGTSRRMAPVLQPGSLVRLEWRARLQDHIGSFGVEPLQSRAHLMADRLALAGLNSICALLRAALPEREAFPALYAVTESLLSQIGARGWTSEYLRWELRLLEEIGFGLDLATCAVTGASERLAYVSPKTGRAVSVEGAGVWADRLFPLPDGLMRTQPLSADAVKQGLRLTGHFLDRGLRPVLQDHPLPEARARLVELLARPA